MTGPIVVILAAGQGTRMRSRVPKLLHPLCGSPLIDWPVAAARAAGAERVVVVDSPRRELSGRLGDSVEVVVQAEPRGTGDALRAAAALIEPGATVLVLAGDMPLIRGSTLSTLLEHHARERAAATMLTAILEDPRGYGRVVRAIDDTVERVVETKVAGDATEIELRIREVSTGTFAFEGAALLEALQQIGEDNAQREIYLPDVLPIMRASERSVIACQLDDPSESLGVNDRRQLATVRGVAQRRILDEHMLGGVTIVDPGATVVDIGVTIGADTVIAPFSSLLGRTEVGTGSTIGPHSTLVDARVGADASVLHSYVRDATIGDGVSVGPFSFVRPDTVLRERSKVGAFVEVKNSDVGVGTKIPHLSYIGDAEIGEQTNLGASTITANYDGFQKHRTKIGSGVRTGVDTTLVAPVELGDGAYTGAGSVISKDVPADALGIARARQRNVEAYAQRRRERKEGSDKS
jgi:bifunctional UDP-N-acetylglucosamine pyrophosphorylase/glucosamine-1-phosphate N-acetyltransferase